MPSQPAPGLQAWQNVERSMPCDDSPMECGRFTLPAARSATR